MKINNFRGELTEASAEKESTGTECCIVMLQLVTVNNEVQIIMHELTQAAES